VGGAWALSLVIIYYNVNKTVYLDVARELGTELVSTHAL
jgi:hypothetical protein